MATTQEPTAPQTSDDRADFKPDYEVRFAVVMYGGVSLAIYINGIAQELLNLVRATAPSEVGSNKALLKQSQLTGAAKVYRSLGEHIIGDPAALNPVPSKTPKPIRTRFVVDVISGTSAGGINGVFLAKALAQDQTMDGLKQLWLSEGDLAKLLNDKRSLEGLPGVELKTPQQSLLNSQRMYGKLLEALAQMDESKAATSVYARSSNRTPSPLIRELDLFTTTTDIEGIPLPIALSDNVVFERRYKNVFHFRYVSGAELASRNDFDARYDPFLAFAARCTSSFPFAFEPMCLKHALDITENYSRYQGAKNHVSEWEDFFRDYLRPGLFDLDLDSRNERATGTLPQGAGQDLRDSFTARAFGDGGYLDNKPFTYATATLMRRYADGPVKRKLLYVEPSPEHPELFRSTGPPPDFVKNVQAALLDLPRQETIREDIDRLYERNRVLKRLNTFAREADEDITSDKTRKVLPPEEFLRGGVSEMVTHYGVGYGAYHRLKVGEITSFLAEIVTRSKGHDPDSDAGLAIRDLVAAWRDLNYSLRKANSNQTQNQFLFDFDFHFRMRKIVFLLRRTNDFLKLDQLRTSEADAEIKQFLRISLNHARADDFEGKPEIDPSIAAEVDSWLDGGTQTSEVKIWLDTFCNELERVKREILSPTLNELRATEDALLSLAETPTRGLRLDDLKQCVDKVQVPWPQLKAILELDGAARNDLAKTLCQKQQTEFGQIANAIKNIIEQCKPRILEKLQTPLRPEITPELFPHPAPAIRERYANQGARSARLCLLYYNKYFINYDMVMYPVEYGTGAGETNVVEVFRVSPEDASSLMEERSGDRNKLAGRTLMSFGAFLDERWRRNDMIWGRLDGAERLICTLLPLPDKIEETEAETPEEKARREKIDQQHEQRAKLIYEAHLGILSDEMKEGNGDAVCRLLSNALFHRHKSSHVDELIEALLAQPKLQRYLTPERRAWFATPQALDRQPDPKASLRYISRSTTVTGNMLDGLADKYKSERAKRMARWLAITGTMFWNVIAVAVPQSLGNLFFRHWIAVLYVFSLVMIFAGTFLDANMNAFGWKALAVTAAINVVVAGLGYYMAGKKRWLQGLRILLGLGVIALIVCGGIFIGQEITALTRVGGLILGAIVAIPILLFVGLQEWRNWRESKRNAETMNNSTSQQDHA